MSAPACDYCSEPSERVTGREVYPHRPELADKVIYRCSPCGAWVGCHPGTDKPLGRLANAGLRKAKMAAHSAFDPLWKAKMRRDECSKKQARGAGYQWLAERLGVEPDACHIGMFDEATCWRVVEACRQPTTPTTKDTGHG
jgi:hypothetical protein